MARRRAHHLGNGTLIFDFYYVCRRAPQQSLFGFLLVTLSHLQLLRNSIGPSLFTLHTWTDRIKELIVLSVALVTEGVS